MELVGALQRLPSVNYIAWNFITPVYLNLGPISDYTQPNRKYLRSSRLPSLYGASYKPSDMVSLVKTALTVC